VTLVLDAAPLLSLADERDPRREEILDVLRSERGRLFIPAPVTAEVDYLRRAPLPCGAAPPGWDVTVLPADR
jgi:hypothetical protein